MEASYLVQAVLLKIMDIGRFFKMKYTAGTNQKTKLYTARFSSKLGFLLCMNKIQNTVNGIADHSTKTTVSGIYGHKALFVAVLRNISSLYSTLSALDTRYGDKITVASNRKIPPGIKCIASCTINTGIEGKIKNIRFQKLSLFKRVLIKSCIKVPNLIDVIHSYSIKLLFKKLCFSESLAELMRSLVRYLGNLSHNGNNTRRVTI